MRLYLISLYPIGSLLTALLAPLAAVEWSSTAFGLQDMSIYFLFAPYSMSQAAFGIYDVTGFGPLSLETLLTALTVEAAARATIVVMVLMVARQIVRPSVAVFASLAVLGIEVFCPLVILLQPSVSWFSIHSAMPFPALGAFSLAFSMALMFKPSLFGVVLNIGRQSRLRT